MSDYKYKRVPKKSFAQNSRRNKFVFQKETAGGFYDPNSVEVFHECRGSWWTIKSVEKVQNQALGLKVTHRGQIRFHDGLTSDMELMVNGVKYNIVSMETTTPPRRYIWIEGEEVK